MHHYRQHPIVLIAGLFECVLLAGLGAGITLLFGQSLWLLLAVPAAVLAFWRCFAWSTFSVRIEGRQVTLRSLNGFVVNERTVSLSAPGGLRTRQNVSGWMFDYGLLTIEVFGTPVQLRYIAPFSALKRQIDRV